jgi:acetyl-CoA C-acetyltransferase/acetyl-CoA acyltransferase
MNPRLAIIDGVRTPFTKAGSDLAGLAADELGRIAVNALLTRSGLDPALIDEVIFGCVAQPMDSANLARVIALRAGIPASVPAATVHRNCASGFESLTAAAERLAAGNGSLFVVGGAESMSQVPMLFEEATARKFAALARCKTLAAKLAVLATFRPADFTPRIGLKLGLTDPVCGLNMGETAELLARENGISREAQDVFAVESHRKALAAPEVFAEEICPVYVNGKVVTRDNGPRAGQTVQVLAGLRPIFEKHGTVTAGNSSQVTDGAAALLVMGEDRAKDLGLEPLGYLTGYAYAGCDPARMGLGPVFALEKLEKRVGKKIEDADVVEINEAFAAQVLAVQKRLRTPVPEEKLNVHGGAIALGHPVGTTGARLVLSALKELRRRNARHAVVSLCIGGGQGGALWLERP